MAKLTESVSAVSNLIRTLLAAVIVGGVGYGGWFAYSTYLEKDANRTQLTSTQRELEETQTALNRTKSDLDRTSIMLTESRKPIDNLTEEVKQKQKEITRLDTSLRLIKVNHRVAQLTVLDQVTDETTGELNSIVEFVELNPEGQPFGSAKQFRIKGDLIYLDNWVVKFDDKYIEQADVDRATSLVLFRRIFGESQQPKDGFPLDEEGGQPAAYARGGEISEFEKKIWGDFWAIANDEQKAAELGIRAAHGEAIVIKVQKGRTYKILLRASDGLSIVPDNQAPPAPGTST